MKPLDLERFTGAEHLNLKVKDMGGSDYAIVDVKPDGLHVVVAYSYQGEWLSNILAAGPSLIAELKALRAWRASVKEACDQFCISENDPTLNMVEHATAYQRFTETLAAAETELNSEIQSNNRS